MQAVSTHFLHNSETYKLAVELNNIGIELLECRAYRSSLSVLRAAISVMKRVVRAEQGQPILTTGADFELLHDARERLHQVENEMACYDNRQFHETLGSPVRIESSSTIAATTAAVASPPPTTNDCYLKQRNTDISSAVILFNYGMVHRWANQENPDREIQESAFRLFKMSYSILSEKDTLAEMQPQDITPNRIFLLLLTLNILAQMQMEWGKYAEANTWASRVITLHRIMGQKEDMEFEEAQAHELMSGVMTIAPAA